MSAPAKEAGDVVAYRRMGALAALLLGLVALELVFAGSAASDYPDKVVPWWHSTPGFFAAYGLAGCLVLLGGAKLGAKLGLQAPEEDFTLEASRADDEGALADPIDPSSQAASEARHD